MKPDTSTPKRTLVKALSWESISTIATFGVAWFMFGGLRMCVTFAIVTFAMKLLLFYGHDRFWHQIPFGKQ